MILDDSYVLMFLKPHRTNNAWPQPISLLKLGPPFLSDSDQLHQHLSLHFLKWFVAHNHPTFLYTCATAAIFPKDPKCEVSLAMAWEVEIIKKYNQKSFQWNSNLTSHNNTIQNGTLHHFPISSNDSSRVIMIKVE